MERGQARTYRPQFVGETDDDPDGEGEGDRRGEVEGDGEGECDGDEEWEGDLDALGGCEDWTGDGGT